jgi:hypothetical protein
MKEGKDINPLSDRMNYFVGKKSTHKMSAFMWLLLTLHVCNFCIAGSRG